jgi:quercetin dioxygenase-like cupin family protein
VSIPRPLQKCKKTRSAPKSGTRSAPKSGAVARDSEILTKRPLKHGYRVGMGVDPSVVWMPGGVRTEIHVVADDTDGKFCLLVDYPPVGWSLPAHRHRNEAETIHIVEGDFAIDVDGARSHLSAGETIHIPRGVTHSGANVGQQLGRRLVLFSPAGMERFFLEAGSFTAQETDRRAVLASAIRHGWEFIRPGV